MAQQALSAMQALVNDPNDTADLIALKTAYNATLTNAQKLLTDFNTKANAVDLAANQMNIELAKLNDMAKGLEILYGKSIAIPGTTVVQPISISYTNEVTMI